MNLLCCDGVSMAYDGHTVVRDVSFDLETGDYMVIVGENGSGKSTFIKGLLGLMKPSRGTIDYLGLKQSEIGYLPQQTVVQKDFPASVMEVALSGCLNRCGLMPFYSRAAKQRALNNLERLGVGELRRKSYRELSGGQQQRVLLARAMCATEKLLLLDEPVNGLDPIMTAELYALIKILNEEQGVTVIMVSHDIHSAVTYGGKILHLAEAPLFFGPTQAYLQTDTCRRMMGGAVYA